MANVRLLPRFGGWALMRWGVIATAVSGVAMAIVVTTGWGGMVTLALTCFVYVAASGLIVANSMARAMAERPQQAGAVSAMMGAAQYGSGMIGSALISLAPMARRARWPIQSPLAGWPLTPAWP
jgi:DHA1 family bicyclomycin/chloramphenicol resistance-like MFS transporter